MALTDDEKTRIRNYLGYPSVNRQSFHALEGALSVIDGDDSGLVLVREFLVELADLDAMLKASRGRLKVAKVDDVRLLGPEEIRALRSEGCRLVERLGTMIDVPLRRSPYGGGSSASFTIGRG